MDMCLIVGLSPWKSHKPKNVGGGGWAGCGVEGQIPLWLFGFLY